MDPRCDTTPNPSGPTGSYIMPSESTNTSQVRATAIANGNTLWETHATLYDSIIYVKVGPGHESFLIHKALLCHFSANFKAALSGDCKEAENGVVILEDEDPYLFQTFKEWLYTGDFPFSFEKPDPNGKNSATWTAMFDLYVFAEKLATPKLQNDLVDAMRRFAQIMDDYPVFELVSPWANIVRASPLRTFLVDFFIVGADVEASFDPDSVQAQALPLNFVMRVARKLQALAFPEEDMDLAIWDNRCDYHIHRPSETLCDGDMSLICLISLSEL